MQPEWNGNSIIAFLNWGGVRNLHSLDTTVVHSTRTVPQKCIHHKNSSIEMKVIQLHPKEEKSTISSPNQIRSWSRYPPHCFDSCLPSHSKATREGCQHFEQNTRTKRECEWGREGYKECDSGIGRKIARRSSFQIYTRTPANFQCKQFTSYTTRYGMTSHAEE